MRVIVENSRDEVNRRSANFVASLVRGKPDCVLGLATGPTSRGVYLELIRMHHEEGLDFSRVTSFNLDEFVGLGRRDRQSNRYFMHQNFFDHINIDPTKTHIPDGRALDFDAHCRKYERRIEDAGGIDLQLLGIGSDGHIAFNEPGSSLGSRTRLKSLTRETIEEHAYLFEGAEHVPSLAITMGVGTILESRRCLLLALGAEKAAAVRSTVEGPITAQVTASALQLHREVIVVLDQEAAAWLERRQYYEEVERAQQRLDSGQFHALSVRRAIEHP